MALQDVSLCSVERRPGWMRCAPPDVEEAAAEVAAAAAGGADGRGAGRGRAQVVQELGTADIDARLEELLIDGILYAFQEQVSDDANVMLNGFGTVVNSLKGRAKPYLPQICGTIKWRLNNKARLASPPDSLLAGDHDREPPTRLRG